MHKTHQRLGASPIKIVSEASLGNSLDSSLAFGSFDDPLASLQQGADRRAELNSVSDESAEAAIRNYQQALGLLSSPIDTLEYSVSEETGDQLPHSIMERFPFIATDSLEFEPRANVATPKVSPRHQPAAIQSVRKHFNLHAKGQPDKPAVLLSETATASCVCTACLIY